MYKKSSTLSHPESSMQPLWRYLSSERLLDLLVSEELFFTHLPHLEDKNEGALTRKSREHLTIWFQRRNQSSWSEACAEVEKYQEQREKFFVNCWHMNDRESYLMWKAYGGRGFAIQTSFERLQASFEATTYEINGGVVDYVDFERDQTQVGNVFNHVITKDLPYRDEREFRLVFWSVGLGNEGCRPVGSGVRVPVDIRMLIQTVVRNPYHDTLDREIERLLVQNGLKLQDSTVRAEKG